MPSFFADTYGFFAHLDGHPEYVRLLTPGDYVTGLPNVAEYAHGLLQRGHDEVLPRALAPVLARVVHPVPTVAAEAARFKQQRRRAGAKCSLVDALGYATARSLDLPFLTGDEDFRGVPGVMFVQG